MKNLPAMVLAAGRGERMRPLTDAMPKPLLKVRGKPLLQWHLEALARAGCPKTMINTAWLGGQIQAAFGTAWGAPDSAAMPLEYSDEQADFGGALETAGGIVRALPRLLKNFSQGESQDSGNSGNSGDGGDLGEGAFWLVAGDVYLPQFAFEAAQAQAFLASEDWAHVWLVPNPAHNPQGDFGFQNGPQGRGVGPGVGRVVMDEGGPRYTYSTLGLYRRAFFEAPHCDIPWGNPQGVRAALAPLLRRAIEGGRVGATLYEGPWTDVGTPERLAELNQGP